MNRATSEIVRDTTCVVLRVGASRYCVPVKDVREVVADATVTPVPGAPNRVSGVISVRGRVVTLVDLRRALGEVAEGTGWDSDRATAVVLDAGRGADLALRVDEVTDVVNLPSDDFQPPPTFGLGGAAHSAAAVVELKSGLSVVLDIAQLLASVGVGADPESESEHEELR